MSPLQPLPGLSKGPLQLWVSAAKVLTRTGRRSSTGRELGRGILAEVTRRHPQHRSAPGAQTWRFAQRALDGSGVSGPRSIRALTARPPARSQRSVSGVTDLRTWLSEEGHLGHSRGSPEKALLRNSQSSADPRCKRW